MKDKEILRERLSNLNLDLKADFLVNEIEHNNEFIKNEIIRFMDNCFGKLYDEEFEKLKDSEKKVIVYSYLVALYTQILSYSYSIFNEIMEFECRNNQKAHFEKRFSDLSIYVFFKELHHQNKMEEFNIDEFLKYIKQLFNEINEQEGKKQ